MEKGRRVERAGWTGRAGERGEVKKRRRRRRKRKMLLGEPWLQTKWVSGCQDPNGKKASSPHLSLFFLLVLGWAQTKNLPLCPSGN